MILSWNQGVNFSAGARSFRLRHHCQAIDFIDEYTVGSGACPSVYLDARNVPYLSRSGWRFQVRIPRDLEGLFGRSPPRLNIGPLGRGYAVRTARLLAGHAEPVFLACPTTAPPFAGTTRGARSCRRARNSSSPSSPKARLSRKTTASSPRSER